MTGLDDAPVVAQVVRNGFVESVHRGLGVVTAADGSVRHAVGNVATLILPRSVSKPMQALAALGCGAAFDPRTLAVACSSHSGEPEHCAAVRNLLTRHGLTVADLRNTADYPLGEEMRARWLAAGLPTSVLAQNCSGKHAGMLAACVASGWDRRGYLEPDHPVQRAIRAAIRDLTGEEAPVVAVDGCGAPLHAVSLVGLARAFGVLAAASEGHERAVADAMRAFPHLVGGTGRDVTALNGAGTGLIAKDGAEGVFAAGLADGTGVAVKVADGAQRARGVLLAEMLRRAGGVPDGLLTVLRNAPVLGHGRPVGQVRWAGPAA